MPAAGGPLGSPGEGEPFILVDRSHGDRVYVSIPQFTQGCAHEAALDECSGNVLWFSINQGRTFSYCQTGVGLGGNDSHIAVDGQGSIYSADLAYFGAGSWMQKLSGRDDTPPTPRSRGDCGFSAPTLASPGSTDRPWLAVYSARPATAASKIFLAVNRPEGPTECSSLDGGVTFEPCVPMITDPALAAEARTGGFPYGIYFGNQVVDRQGTVYAIFVTAAPSGWGHNVYVAKSEDGLRFTNHPVHIGLPPGTSEDGNSNAIYWFFSIAVDRADSLYAAWTETRLAGARYG